jgi:hypothetical protein
MDFELIESFSVKFELTIMCSHRLIATTIANPPEHKFGHDLIHCDIQCLHYDLVYMHKLNPKIQEVMEFQRYLLVKLIQEKFSSGNHFS